MTTAILIDGAFFIKRIRHFEPDNHFNTERMANLVMEMAFAHLRHKINNKTQTDDLYKIFFYDCAPLTKKMHFPFSKKSIDFAKSDEAKFRQNLHNTLIKKRKLVLRLGKLADKQTDWRIKSHVQKELIQGKRTWDTLNDNDMELNIQQKGVDMKIGLDIATLALKKHANKIVLIAGDADFVPAAKLARREGIDFILDPIHQNIADDLFEHIDGLRSTYYQKKEITS